MNIEMIEAAADRLRGHGARTPLLSAPGLDAMAGRRVFVKAECLQKTGSFKFRGAWSAITALDPGARRRGVVAFSSGNHAQGVALAAKMHEIPATIVMPSDAPKSKIDNTRLYGAEIVLYDRATEDRDEIGLKLAETTGATLIKPFDMPDVIAGQGTIGLELAEQTAEVGIGAADVLVCCGGGGLTAGIALGLEAKAPALRPRPVEPVGFDDVARSLRSGRIERNATTAGSICDAIITPSPGQLTFPIMQRLCGPGIVVPEEDCLRAMAAAFTWLKIVLEPGGAIALAAALFHGSDVAEGDVVVIASGGNVDTGLFTEAITRFA